MPTSNNITLIGNLTRDPEIKTFDKYTVCSFGIAWNTPFKKEDGTSFFDVEIWGKKGEAFARFHKKGDKAYVSGYIEQESWKDKETGKVRYSYRIKAEDFDLRPKGGGSDQGGTASPQQGDQQPTPGEIPF